MVDNIIYEMIGLTDQKLKELNIILNLKPKQKEAIQQENMEGIGSTIDKLQNQIKKIDEIDSLYFLKLNELKSNTCIENISQLDDIKYPDTKILKDKQNRIKSMLEAIKIMDDENNYLMNEKFRETKDKLKNLRQGQKMAKGYFMDHSSNMFIDERN